MHALIDKVVERLAESPCWQKESIESVAGIIKELKTQYDCSTETLYSKSQVRELMGLTAKLCGQAVSNGSGKDG